MIEECNWITPRKGYVIIYEQAGEIIPASDVIHTDTAHDDNFRWGYVGHAGSTDLKVGDCVVFSKFEGHPGPSLFSEKKPVIVSEDQIKFTVNKQALDDMLAQRRRDEAAAAARLASERKSLIVEG